jgi:hypothetical protein
MLRVNVPAVTVCAPKVWAETALRPTAVELYNNTQSNAVVNVTEVKTIEADGVTKAVVPVDNGAVAVVTTTPPATYPAPTTSLVAEYAVVAADMVPVVTYRAALNTSFVVAALITEGPKACKPFNISCLKEVAIPCTFAIKILRFVY